MVPRSLKGASLSDFYKLLADVQLLVFILVGFVALYRWKVRGGRHSAWMAATFCLLAVVVLAARLINHNASTGAPLLLVQVVLVLLVAFPYLLFRFAAVFKKPSLAMESLALILTSVTAGSAFLFSSFPKPGETRPFWFEAWIILFLCQWAFLLSVVGIGLWRAGSKQPKVARSRMRFLGFASVLLAVAAIVGGLRSPPPEPAMYQAFVRIMSTLAGPLCLLGFAPPQWVVWLWRRGNLKTFREVELSLMKAGTSKEVAELFVPSIAQILGGDAALMMERDGNLLGSKSCSDEEIALVRTHVVGPDNTDINEFFRLGNLFVVVGDVSVLAVRETPYAPYFADDEEQILRHLALLADLAVARTTLLETERRQREQLAAANESLKEFIAVASHELRTPITVIQGFSSTMQRAWAKTSDDQRLRYLEAIERHSLHLRDLVNELLTLPTI